MNFSIRYVVLGVKILCAIAFIYSVTQIVLKQADTQRSKATYKEIREIVKSEKSSDETVAIVVKAPDQTDAMVAAIAVEEPEQVKIDPFFNPLLEMNDETVGWLQIPGTEIDYPVVRGTDNDFYLDVDFQKKPSSGGAIFMDYRNRLDPLDQNTVLYGHHMKDGTMFKDLVKFLDKSFLQSHDTIHFRTLHEEAVWRIFAVFVTNTEFDYIRPNYASNEDFRLFVDNLKSKADLPDEWMLDKEAHILTLSTCSYDYDDARLVVQAVLLD